jgi:isochorismate synthase
MNAIPETYFVQFCQYLQNNTPFVAYRLPESEKISVFVAGSVKKFVFTGNEDIFSEEGFVVVPFDNENQSAYLLKKAVEPTIVNEKADKEDIQATDYFDAFDKIQEAIARKDISKAVLSRKLYIENIPATQAIDCFLHLCKKTLPAYCYLLYLPETGVWVGASPELFLKKNAQLIETVSLAGTRSCPDKDTGAETSVGFGEKEKEEQGIVSDYVAEVLERFGIPNPERKESIATAGNMQHLKTVFSFPTKNLKKSISKLVEALHPTPAVCGYPKQQAKTLILKTEKHKRHLYSGFLGKIEENGACELFVNIRCIRFEDGRATVYAGGGITGKSEAKAEWLETELKMNNILEMFNINNRITE